MPRAKRIKPKQHDTVAENEMVNLMEEYETKELIGLRAMMVANKAEMLNRLDMLAERVKSIESRDGNPNHKSPPQTKELPQGYYAVPKSMLISMRDILSEFHATHAYYTSDNGHQHRTKAAQAEFILSVIDDLVKSRSPGACS